MKTRLSFLTLATSIAFAAALGACTTNTVVKKDPPAAAVVPSDEAPVEGEGGGGTEEESVGQTPPLVRKNDSRVIAALREGGVEIEKLPEDLSVLADEPDHERLKAVMKSFTIALGTTCDGCHVEGAETLNEFKTSTPRKEIAKKMWERYVVSLKRQDGKALYCDNCHQGKMEFLDRSDKDALANWMKSNFVEGLARKDGAEHDCATCHGTGSSKSFLESWKTPTKG